MVFPEPSGPKNIIKLRDCFFILLYNYQGLLLNIGFVILDLEDLVARGKNGEIRLMKSISVIHSLGCPIDFNGNITRVVGQAIAVARKGVNVRVVVADSVPRSFFSYSIQNGVKVDYFSTVNISWKVYKKVGWRINNLSPLFFKVLEVAKNEHNAILHVAAPTPIIKPLSASEAGKRLKKPIVLDLHDPWSSSPFSFNPASLLQTSIMRRVVRNADHVLVPYKALFNLMKSIDKKKPITIIPNAVDSELFRPMKRNIQLSNSLGIGENNIVVAFSGHVEKSKGLITLLHSAQKIAQISKNVVFLIIGDGSAMPEIRSLIKKNGLDKKFRLVGHVPQKSVVDYLSLADICVAPYSNEDFFKVSLPETPLKVVEYLAMEKPVIMSRISDKNVVNWSNGGFLFNPGDAQDLSSKIINLIDDENLRKILGRNGRKYVELNLSWKNYAETLIEIYNHIQH